MARGATGQFLKGADPQRGRGFAPGARKRRPDFQALIYADLPALYERQKFLAMQDDDLRVADAACARLIAYAEGMPPTVRPKSNDGDEEGNLTPEEMAALINRAVPEAVEVKPEEA